MGWRPEEGYYQKHMKEEGFSNKITDEQEKFNKLKLDEISEGIKIAQIQLAKDRGENPTEIKKSDEPIEYVLADTEDELDR